MKRFWKIAILSVLAVICALGLLACGDTGSSGGKTGLQYKKMAKDDTFYTVYAYYPEEGVDKLDLSTYNKDGVVIGRIMSGAFDGNESLKELVIPTTVEKIDEGAFKGMRKLESLTVPFIGLNAIADGSYNDQASTEKAVDMERTFGHFFGTEEYNFSVSYTQKYNASGTSDRFVPMTLKTVKIVPANDYTVPMYAFSGNNIIEKVETDAKVKIVGENAFENCTRLNEVIVAGVTKVYKNAFYGCTALKSIELTAVTEIGDSAFQKSGIRVVTLLDGVSYGENVYRESAVTTVNVSVANVPNGTFKGCQNLTVVNVGVNTVFGNYSLADLGKACTIIKNSGVTVSYLSDLATENSTIN
jgi:hypothetical protein